MYQAECEKNSGSEKKKEREIDGVDDKKKKKS